MKIIFSLLFLLCSTTLFAEEGMSYIEYSMKQTELAKFKNLENYKKNTQKKKANTAIVSSQNGRVLQEVSTKKAAPSRMYQTLEQPALRRLGNDLSFSYGVEFLGPSLSNQRQDGSTYNRFKTGQDWKGDDQDATGSHQFYHSLTLGYQLSQNTKIYYAYTFQDDINDGIEYETTNLDGSTSTWERDKGVSDNNKRIGATFFNVINNDYIGFSMTTFYEFASTVGSDNKDMDYGLGIAPSLFFKSSTPGLSYGVSAEIQRNFYKKQEYYSKCGSEDCPIATKHQTMLISVSPYVSYMLSDITTVSSTLKFDWDQKGDEVEDFDVYNDNMDDIVKLGMSFNLAPGITTGLFLDIALEDPNTEKTALGLNANFNIF